MNKPDYSFQSKLVSQCLEHLRNHSSGGVVLASAPGAGKTEMSIEVIERWVEENKKKVLVLTHGQTVLRSQYFNRLQRKERNFSFGMLNSKNPTSEDSVQVSLPHHFTDRDAHGYGLIVVDEAHHFFSAPMVQNVLKANPEAKLLMLTGTPSPFIAMKTFPIVSFTASQLLEQGVITDPFIELVKTKLPFTLKNFNQQDNLVEGAEFTSKQVNSSLDSALSQLLNTLTARLKGTRNPKRYFKKLSGKKLKSALAQLDFGKTMVICHRQDQARDVVAYFKAKGISALLSVSDDDTDSANVELFRTDSTKVLVVVNRATLGFDLPSLRNIIDLSMTHNPDRIFQALCRVVRRGLNGDKKTFIKVTTDGLAALTYVVMSFVVALSLPEYYETFDGRWKDRKVRIKKSSGPSGEHTGKGKKSKSPWEDLLPLPSLIDIKGMMSADSSLYAYTTFNEVRARLDGTRYSPGHWTLERCKEEALKYGTITSFQRGSSSAYKSSRKNGWLEVVSAHMTKKRQKYSKEQFLQIASKVDSRRELKVNYPGLFASAVKHNWLILVPKLSTKQTRPAGYWSEERVREEASKYSNTHQLRINSRSAYDAAVKFKLMEELCPNKRVK
ncbi:MAG: hypothetical protein E6R04_09385, partial [Spirochaetes bacterium]